MESSDSKKRGHSRKIEQGNDEVRVILEGEGESSSGEEDPYHGFMRGALWTQILSSDQKPEKVIAPVLIQNDLQIVDSLLDPDSSKANSTWKLYFNPKEVGEEKDAEEYELESLPRH